MKRIVGLAGLLWLVLLAAFAANVVFSEGANFQSLFQGLLGFLFVSFILLLILVISLVTRTPIPEIQVLDQGFYLLADEYKTPLISWQDVASVQRVMGKYYGIAVTCKLSAPYKLTGLIYGLGGTGFIVDVSNTKVAELLRKMQVERPDLGTANL